MFIAVTMFICVEGFGQELSKLRDKAKGSVEEKRPDWKIVSKREDGSHK